MNRRGHDAADEGFSERIKQMQIIDLLDEFTSSVSSIPYSTLQA